MANATPDAAEGVRLLEIYRKDFVRFCADVLKIQTKKAELIPFVLNRAQRRVWQLIEEDIEAGRPVRFYILKARQLGFSTLIQAVMYWLCSLRRNRTALVCAHEEGAAASLFLKSQIFFKSSVEQFRPALRLANRQELHFANPNVNAPAEEMGLESRIIVRTANNKNLGASLTLQGLHLSEFAKYEGVLQHVKVAIATVLQTVPDLPGTFVFLETTADGMGYAYDYWHADNGYRKVFVSWVAEESYTCPADDLSLGLADLDDVDDSRFGNEQWVRERVVEELKFWYPEKADDEEWLLLESLCRLQWRRRMIAGQFSDDKDLFRQEYPITAEEAFLTSGAAVFDQRRLRDTIYALHEHDDYGAVIPEKYVYPSANYRFDRDRGDFYATKHGPLRVYHPFKPGKRYVIGADVAEGYNEGDFSAAQVLELPELRQVATFQDRIEPDEFGDVLFHIGRIYGWAALCVEANGPGLVTNNRLGKELRYPNLYRREVMDKDRRVIEKKWGWHTNRGNKSVMVNDLRAAVRDDLLHYRDVPTLKEMCSYVVHDDGKFGALKGEHDDLVMALALAVQMVRQSGVDLIRRPVNVNTEAPRTHAPKYSFEWWVKQAQSEKKKAFTADHYKAKFGTG